MEGIKNEGLPAQEKPQIPPELYEKTQAIFAELKKYGVDPSKLDDVMTSFEKKPGKPSLLQETLSSVENWQPIYELYRTLQKYHDEPYLHKIVEESKFYANQPNPLNLIPIIAAAEQTNETLLDQDDPTDVREAINELEKILAEKEKLMRIEFLRWQVFPLSSDQGYQIKQVKINRRAPGQIIRIIVPAYKDKDGQINSRGTILITG